MRRLLIAWVLGVASVTPFAVDVTAQEDADVAKEAAQAVESFITAWNTGDNVELRKAMHFPFVTMANGNVIVAEQPADFSTDFEGMREQNDWHHSTLDATRVVHTYPTSAYVEMDYSRVNSAGERYFSGTVMYIVNLRDGGWRLQFRSPVGDRPSTGRPDAR